MKTTGDWILLIIICVVVLAAWAKLMYDLDK